MCYTIIKIAKMIIRIRAICKILETEFEKVIEVIFRVNRCQILVRVIRTKGSYSL